MYFFVVVFQRGCICCQRTASVRPPPAVTQETPENEQICPERDFTPFWLSSVNGLNRGSLSSGYCGSYSDVLGEAASQTAAQRGARGAAARLHPGVPRELASQNSCAVRCVFVQPLAFKLKSVSGKGSASFLLIYFSCCCVCS